MRNSRYLVGNEILVRVLVRGVGVFSFQMKILNPNQLMSKDQVAVSASIPPPLRFPPKVWALQAQTYKYKCMDNMIFLIIILLCIVFICLK